MSSRVAMICLKKDISNILWSASSTSTPLEMASFQKFPTELGGLDCSTLVYILRNLSCLPVVSLGRVTQQRTLADNQQFSLRACWG